MKSPVDIISQTKMSKKREKYPFTLDIDVKKVNKKYGLQLVEDTRPNNTTDIGELTGDKGTPDIVSFLDESKRVRSCSVSMVDFRSGKSVEEFPKECWWCLHPCTSFVIGVPVKKVPNQAIKSYHSEISKSVYSIKENITSRRKEDIKDPRVSINNVEHYETDGAFCSFNCAASFIDENKCNELYRNSEYLLTQIHALIVGVKNSRINRAPHWRRLKKRGGDLTIEEFRSKFNKVDIEFLGTLKSSVLFRPLVFLYEEKPRF